MYDRKLIGYFLSGNNFSTLTLVGISIRHIAYTRMSHFLSVQMYVSREEVSSFPWRHLSLVSQ